MKTIINAALLSFAAITAATADDDIQLRDCPQAVQDTIQSNLRDGRLDDIDRITVKGETRYISEIDLPGDRDLKLHIASDGALIKSREDVSIREVPGSVKAALDSFGGRIDDLEKEVTGNETTWHADIDRENQPDLDVVIAADGKVIRQTEDDD